MLPRLTTARLVLDAYTPQDLPALVALLRTPEIAAWTLAIPHPFTAADGERWMADHLLNFAVRQNLELAVRLQGQLIGTVGLRITRACDQAELGYWIGQPFWGCGYATEAARAVVAFGFSHFNLEKIISNHFAGNEASGRVLQKIGFSREGFHPRHAKKNDTYIDMVSFGLTRAAAASTGRLVETPEK